MIGNGAELPGRHHNAARLWPGFPGIGLLNGRWWNRVGRQRGKPPAPGDCSPPALPGCRPVNPGD